MEGLGTRLAHACIYICVQCVNNDCRYSYRKDSYIGIVIAIRTCGSSTNNTVYIDRQYIGPESIYLIQRHAIVITAAKPVTASRRDILIPAINPPTMSPVCCSPFPPSAIDSEGVAYNY